MEAQLAQFEEYRKKKMKLGNWLIVWGAISLFVGIVLGLGVEPFFLGIGMVLALFLIAFGAMTKKNVEKKFKDEFIVGIVNLTYPGCNYRPYVGLNLNELMEPGFFRWPDRYFSEDLLLASWDGIPFAMVDFTLQDEHRHTDSKGHTTVTYTTYAKGRHMVFDFQREFNQVLKVLETTSLGANLRGLEKQDTESIAFNKKFKCYTSDPHTMFYVLTPQIQEKLLELETKFKGSIFFAFMNGKFYLTINDSVNTLEMKVNKTITLESLTPIIDQLNVPAAVINELKLSSDKFNSLEREGL